MHRDHDVFTKAIEERKKIRLIFSDNDGRWQAMSVIPLDYTPGRRTTDKSSSYQFWDLKIGANGTPLILFTEQIQGMELDVQTFNSDDFVKVALGENQHRRQFFIKRDWGFSPDQPQESQ